MKTSSSMFLKDASKEQGGGAPSIRVPLCASVSPVVIAFRAFGDSVYKVCQLWLAALHEIFDEAAYQRYLLRNRQIASVETYAAFCRDHESLASRRPRCC